MFSVLRFSVVFALLFSLIQSVLQTMRMQEGALKR